MSNTQQVAPETSQESPDRVNDTAITTTIDDCPIEGLTHNPKLMELNRLKNRTLFPQASDYYKYDVDISLAKMLAPGDDRERWNSDMAAEITGYVYDVKIGGVETCNCKAKDPAHRDTHIELVLDPMNGGGADKIIVEVTPRIRNIMAAKGVNWSTKGLRDKILGRRVRVKGWLLFDEEHLMQAENTNPGNERNWRKSCWELHPVTSIEVVNRKP